MESQAVVSSLGSTSDPSLHDGKSGVSISPIVGSQAGAIRRESSGTRRGLSEHEDAFKR